MTERLDIRLSRRKLLAAGATGLALAAVAPHVRRALAAPPVTCASLSDIQHVVIMIQENRSFDHYFGTYRGVRGFADASARKDGRSIFYQPNPANSSDPPTGYLLPFHLDTKTQNAYCTADITHDWWPQHRSWNGGAMDQFATTHLAEDPNNGQLTMGYYARADAPFFYAVADAFTICDQYFCSVMGPTDPNRLFTMSATVDPDGKNGGPLLQTLVENRQEFYGRFTWATMPEQLQAAGISWKVYSPPDSNLENNVLAYFKNFQDPASPLFRNAFVPAFPGTFQADAAAGTLPQVSWVLAPLVSSEHPPAPPSWGEDTLHQVLSALTANPALWQSTALFVTYDENGGFFDHVPPPTAPANTPGEWITGTPVPDASVLGSPPMRGPLGLGFRVPMLVISPFSRGGFVSSTVFDHTSPLLFLERRFGVQVPNISAWRRRTVGDMTAAFNFAARDPSLPALPATAPVSAEVIAQCASNGSQVSTVGLTAPAYPVPNPQRMPLQEPGSARRPSGLTDCAAPSPSPSDATGLDVSASASAAVDATAGPVSAGGTAQTQAGGSTQPAPGPTGPQPTPTPLTGSLAVNLGGSAGPVGAAGSASGGVSVR
ncbi:MAG: phospholipase [Chloroflexi bacterium]|nr:phospholipase [Chloroflexota bacterium]